MHNFFVRLREQRDAHGLSQQALAELCGVSLRSQQNYEKGERSPDVEYIGRLHAAGFDVLYLVTGLREQVGTSALPRDEAALLDNYRNSPPDARAAIKAASDAFAQPKRKRSGE